MARSESGSVSARRLLVTAGPTHEPIDAVRYLGNRSSGLLGIALADEAARRGWEVSLLLGPTALAPDDARVAVRRFRTAEELAGLLAEEQPSADILIMAAAVADFRPRTAPGHLEGKLSRGGSPLTLELEPTPDLLAACAGRRRSGQLLVGFALEPEAEMVESARAKLERKGIDLIVANPLETMESPDVRAVVLLTDGRQRPTAGAMPKPVFAGWLLDLIEEVARASEP